MVGGGAAAADREASGAFPRLARPALAKRLNAALTRGGVLVVAGAGYGKTTAVEDALAQRGTAAAWMRCTAIDEDAGQFLTHLVAAVRSTVPGAVDVLAERLSAAQERIDVPAVADELVTDLRGLLVDRLTIVVDDAEWLEGSAAALEILRRLLSSGSDRLRCVVLTRRQLPLRVAKLRNSGALSEFGTRDLAFTVEECERLLAARGDGARVDVEADAERLFEGTDGWPLGVMLAVLRGHGAGVDSTSRREIGQFLREEVLDRLDPDVRRLVLFSSVPRDLDARCARALGFRDDFVDEVARAGLPLRASQADRAWLAYHPLVREFLLERFESEYDPERRRAVHACVASAMAAAGRREDAVEHWLAAEAWPQAAEAIATVGAELVHRAPATVKRWLQTLPCGTRGTPGCLLLEGTLDWEAGRFAEAVERLRGACAGFAAAGDVPRMWFARFALADPLTVTGRWDEAIALADGFDEAPADEAGVLAPAVAAYAAGALGALGRTAECAALSRRLVAHPHLGRYAAARTVWEFHTLLLAGELEELVGGARDAVREFERHDPVNRLPILLQLLATALGHAGRDTESLAVWERVEVIGDRANLCHIRKTSHVWRALLHARGGRREVAEEHLARAMVMPRASGWSDYMLHTARACLAALRGDAAEAVSASDSALAIARPAPLTDRFHAAIELAPILAEAGLAGRARALVEEELALCDERVPGASGRYFRSLLLAVRAWLRVGAGDDAGGAEDLAHMWLESGPAAAAVIRRAWPLLEPLLWRALERDDPDGDEVIRTIAAALPDGAALVAFARHPHPRVRAAALPVAAASGHPTAVAAVAQLTSDPDPQVAMAAVAAATRLRSSPPPLSYSLFGAFRVRRGRWLVTDAEWDRRVAQRLVRFLLIHRSSGVPDDLLLEAFWGDKPTDAARRSLRVAVSCARSVLDVPGAPSVIDVAEGTLHISLRERDSVDIDRFQQAAVTAIAARDGRRALLERATELWTGDPLPEERYTDWATHWREALTFRYAEVLTALVRECAADGDHVAATHVARRLVALDPLNEAAQRELITAYARSGRRAHALRQYLECRRALVADLGIEPTAETTALHRRILAAEPV